MTAFKSSTTTALQIKRLKLMDFKSSKSSNFHVFHLSFSIFLQFLISPRGASRHAPDGGGPAPPRGAAALSELFLHARRRCPGCPGCPAGSVAKSDTLVVNSLSILSEFSSEGRSDSVEQRQVRHRST